MANKKKSWFTLVKRFFVSDSQSHQEKKEKRRKWVFARLRMKRIPSLTAPQLLSQTQQISTEKAPNVSETEQKQSNYAFSAAKAEEKQSSYTIPVAKTEEKQSNYTIPVAKAEEKQSNRAVFLSRAEEKHSNHAVSVAIASAVAAEAAVAAAHAAVEVVRLTSTPLSGLSFPEEGYNSIPIEDQIEDDIRSMRYHERKIEESSAIMIQTAFRGYIARKALRALKGIVTLQAIIRGRAVRRQAVTTLKRLQSIINIQSQICANRFQSSEGHFDCHNDDDDNNQFNNFRDKMLRMDSFNQRRWDDSLLSKEEADASFMSKKEAAIRRERIKEYWNSHRRSAESERKQVSGRWRYWLEQWVDTQLSKSKELEDLDTKPKNDFDTKKLRLRNLQTHSSPKQSEFENSPSIFAPRNKLTHTHTHKRQFSLGDENSSSFTASSPIVPTYMAATESAKAKARSLSSPKLRPESIEGFSPSKNKLSLVSSITSEVPISMGRVGDYLHQRSPSLKGVRGPVKSSRKIKEMMSVDSECSLAHWNQHNTF